MLLSKKFLKLYRFRRLETPVLNKLLRTNKPLALMLIKAQKEVFSSIVGNHITRSKGQGFDFSELRPYETGDDIKHIDWIISSKLDQPHVKVFHQQRELNITIVSFLTASVGFGTSRLKQELIAEMTALISMSCVKQGDPYEAYIANENLTLVSKKSKQLFGVRNLVQHIFEYATLGQSVYYPQTVSALYKRLKQKSLIFLIGDFFDSDSLDIKTLSLKHEVVVLMVRDRFEEEPPILESLSVVDPVKGEAAELKLDKSALKKYQARLQAEDERLQEKLKKSGVRFVKVYTDENPAKKIFSLMGRR